MSEQRTPYQIATTPQMIVIDSHPPARRVTFKPRANASPLLLSEAANVATALARLAEGERLEGIIDLGTALGLQVE